MQQNHQGLHCLLGLKQTLGTETHVHHNLEASTLQNKLTIPYLLYQYKWENIKES